MDGSEVEWVIVWILYIFEEANFFKVSQVEDTACQSDSDCRRCIGIKDKFQEREWGQLLNPKAKI